MVEELAKKLDRVQKLMDELYGRHGGVTKDTLPKLIDEVLSDES